MCLFNVYFLYKLDPSILNLCFYVTGGGGGEEKRTVKCKRESIFSRISHSEVFYNVVDVDRLFNHSTLRLWP